MCLSWDACHRRRAIFAKHSSSCSAGSADLSFYSVEASVMEPLTTSPDKIPPLPAEDTPSGETRHQASSRSRRGFQAKLGSGSAWGIVFALSACPSAPGFVAPTPARRDMCEGMCLGMGSQPLEDACQGLRIQARIETIVALRHLDWYQFRPRS